VTAEHTCGDGYSCSRRALGLASGFDLVTQVEEQGGIAAMRSGLIVPFRVKRVDRFEPTPLALRELTLEHRRSELQQQLVLPHVRQPAYGPEHGAEGSLAGL
jgi:hypothetical protein